jgi:hypothetical protein
MVKSISLHNGEQFGVVYHSVIGIKQFQNASSRIRPDLTQRDARPPQAVFIRDRGHQSIPGGATSFESILQNARLTDPVQYNGRAHN